MNTNLDVDKYQNGDPIPYVKSSKWDTLTSGAYCYYDNDSATYAPVYGKLYNWYAVNDSRGLAPKGWHIPTDKEWETLCSCLGGYGVAGGKLKHTDYWKQPNTGATNSSKFSALPGGVRAYGVFNNLGFVGMWWSSSEPDTLSNKAWSVTLGSLSSYFIAPPLTSRLKTKTSGFSVRCIQNN